MQRALSFKNSPPASVPLRFLFTAPIFVILAALLLVWAGPVGLSSRWTGEALALTHLLTLGVLATAMTGAVMQILPVAAGIQVLATRITAMGVHALLSLGTVLLAMAFLTVKPGLFSAALLSLAAAALWFVVALLGGLWKDKAHIAKGARQIVMTTRLAGAALLVTATMGVLLATGYAWGWPFSRVYTDLHAAWGLLGWVGLLVAAMAYQVIPMFQVTEIYPRAMTRWFGVMVFMMLVVSTFNALADTRARYELSLALGILMAGAFLWFAITTFYLLWTRKRPSPDTTTLFWRTATLSLAACVPVWLMQTIGGKDYSVTLGVLFIVGFAWSAINGMLYKIIPFLLWYHAQKDLEVALKEVPKVREILPDPVARRQFWPQLAALLLLIAASFWPQPYARPAALVQAFSAAWLLMNMVGALLLYRRSKDAIANALARRSAEARSAPHQP